MLRGGVWVEDTRGPSLDYPKILHPKTEWETEGTTDIPGIGSVPG